MTRTVIAEPNITPLIDVLLVLLIIFMIVVPVAPRGLDAALPASARDSTVPPLPALVVELDASGVRLNRMPYTSLDELGAGLRDALDARTEKTVMVKADGTVPYGAVVGVMDEVRGAGATRIGLVSAAFGANR
jgi:biopolymer transport protein TolR